MGFPLHSEYGHNANWRKKRFLMHNHRKIEKKWRKIWLKNRIYEPDLKRAEKPFYNLMMFPYPSAEGLHVGNVYAFVGSDIYGRFKRMQGNDVFEPIGLDGFGIHSENYALKTGVHPMKQAKISEKRFYQQLQMIGNGFAWEERLETYNPSYYKWTQWIFIQMFRNGLAYRKKQAVNWCPSCKTVLADEQVIDGKCERCGSKVIKKELEQWFFRITKYAERLLKNLKKIDWSEKVKTAQREWIGKSEGALIKFPISRTSDVPKLTSILKTSDVPNIEVFTTRPDTLFGATYLVLAPEHKLISSIKHQVLNWKKIESYIKKAKKKSDLQRTDLAKEKTGVELRGIKAINPANKKEIPIWVADYVLASYGTGAIMAVPAHDERDFEFAKKFRLPIIKVINPVVIHVANPAAKANTAVFEVAIGGEPWEGEGELINSEKFSGLDSEKAKWEIIKFVGGKKQIQYHLRDWLISRQRYWGVPIPMIYCEHCAAENKGERKEMPGWYAAVKNQLPIKLPFIKNFRPKGKGESPLASEKSFFEVKCSICGLKARRETDVSDTFLDSAWYYLRYPSVKDKKRVWSSELTEKWLPVDTYIGGAEHSVLHLLYSRFLTMVFHDLKFLGFDEPFSRFRAHGLLISEGAKMSKSRGNVVIPDEYIRKFGADVLRMYLMFLAPFEQGGDFRDAGILGIKRFMEKIYKLISNQRISAYSSASISVTKLLHRTIKKVTEDIENLRYNTAISALMILFSEMEKNKESLVIGHWSTFLKLLAPFAPHLSEELYQELKATSGEEQTRRRFKSIHREAWPKYNSKLIKEENFELVIQINGKVRDRALARLGISQKEAEKSAFSQEKIRKLLSGQKIKKIIFVPNRLINIVL